MIKCLKWQGKKSVAPQIANLGLILGRAGATTPPLPCLARGLTSTRPGGRPHAFDRIPVPPTPFRKWDAARPGQGGMGRNFRPANGVGGMAYGV